MDFKILYLQVGALIELLGIVTLITNEDSILPYADLGFEIPVVLFSADIQGVGLFVAGSALTVYSIYLMKNS